jgi:hypothetical protein
METVRIAGFEARVIFLVPERPLHPYWDVARGNKVSSAESRRPALIRVDLTAGSSI